MILGIDFCNNLLINRVFCFLTSSHHPLTHFHLLSTLLFMIVHWNDEYRKKSTLIIFFIEVQFLQKRKLFHCQSLIHFFPSQTRPNKSRKNHKPKSKCSRVGPTHFLSILSHMETTQTVTRPYQLVSLSFPHIFDFHHSTQKSHWLAKCDSHAFPPLLLVSRKNAAERQID